MKTQRIATYIILGLMALVAIAALIFSGIYHSDSTRLQIVWMGTGLLELNLLVALVFLRRNLR